MGSHIEGQAFKSQPGQYRADHLLVSDDGTGPSKWNLQSRALRVCVRLCHAYTATAVMRLKGNQTMAMPSADASEVAISVTGVGICIIYTAFLAVSHGGREYRRHWR